MGFDSRTDGAPGSSINVDDMTLGHNGGEVIYACAISRVII